MTLAFRSVDAAFADAVQTWPYEALVETIERGLIGDWTPIPDELRTEPWGVVAGKVQRWAVERAEVARRVRAAIGQSGVTAAEFALLVGTSASGMSTYANGRVMPSAASAALLLRIERTGKHRRVTSGSQ